MSAVEATLGTSHHCPHGADGGLYCAAGKCSVADAPTLDLARAAVQSAAPWARAELQRRHVSAFGFDDGCVLVIRGPHLSDTTCISVADESGNAQQITLAPGVVADVAACLGAVEIDRLRRVVERLEAEIVAHVAASLLEAEVSRLKRVVAKLEEEATTMRARAELAEARTAVPRSAP